MMTYDLVGNVDTHMSNSNRRKIPEIKKSNMMGEKKKHTDWHFSRNFLEEPEVL